LRTSGTSIVDPAVETAYAAARNLCRRKFKDAFFAAAFLPAPKRRAVHSIIAFCNMIADAFAQASAGAEAPSTIAPSSCSATSLDQTLSLLTERLDDIYDQRLDLPLPEFRDQTQHILYAFSKTVERYSIPKELFLHFAESCRMGKSISRYATWTSLEKYCHRAGGSIALAIGCVLGLQHSDAYDQIAQLGSAIKFTLILRDLKQHVSMGRIYLPLEDLAQFKVTQRELSAGTVSENFRKLMQFEIDRAREMYRQGAQGLCWLADDGTRLAASVISTLSSGILAAIERQNYDVFSKPPALTTLQKFRRLAPAWRLARRIAIEPVPNVFG
jgi:phytoene synthase